MEVVGLTVLEEPVPIPLLHEYVFAPLAVITAEEPLQIIPPPPAVTVGNEVAVTTTFAVFEQLLPFDNVTV